MNKIDDYGVIVANTSSELEDKVRAAINRHFVPHGPMQALAIPAPNAAPVLYIQAMVHYKTSQK